MKRMQRILAAVMTLALLMTGAGFAEETQMIELTPEQIAELTSAPEEALPEEAESEAAEAVEAAEADGDEAVVAEPEAPETAPDAEAAEEPAEDAGAEPDAEATVEPSAEPEAALPEEDAMLPAETPDAEAEAAAGEAVPAAISKPVIEVADVEIEPHSFVVHARILSDGGAAITEYGVVDEDKYRAPDVALGTGNPGEFEYRVESERCMERLEYSIYAENEAGRSEVVFRVYLPCCHEEAYEGKELVSYNYVAGESPVYHRVTDRVWVVGSFCANEGTGDFDGDGYWEIYEEKPGMFDTMNYGRCGLQEAKETITADEDLVEVHSFLPLEGGACINGQECYECGYVMNCTHEGEVVKDYWYYDLNDENLEGQCVNDGNPKVHYWLMPYDVVFETCGVCNEELGDYEESGWYKDWPLSHEFNEEGICYDCGYKAEVEQPKPVCLHAEIEFLGRENEYFFRSGEYRAIDDIYHYAWGPHNYYSDIYRCKECGIYFGKESSGEYYDYFGIGTGEPDLTGYDWIDWEIEKHELNKGVCVQCGQEVEVTPELELNASTVKIGVDEKFTLEVLGWIANELSFTSENAKIAAVDKNGVVTGKKAGETKIIVSADGETAEVAVTVVKAPTKVTLSAKKLSLGAGQTETLIATPNNGSESAVTFTTSKASVATVDENGVITAVGKGTAKITATTYNKKKASCTVTVLAAPESIELNKTSLVLPAGMQAQLTASVNRGAAAAYSFASSDESVAIVDADGKLSAVSAGAAVITVTSYNGLTAQCAVTVTEAPASIRLNASAVTLGVKETLQLVPTNDQGCEIEYSYASGSTKVATVDKSGKVTAKKAGTTTITVTSYNGLTASCEITVMKAPSKISLPAKKLNMGAGQSEQLVVQLSSGSAGAVSFSSSKASVAAVDASGVITAVGKGTATITAKTYNGKSAKCTVTVHAAPESLTLAESSITLPAGMTLDLKPEVNKGSYANYSCASSDEAVVTVSSEGEITAVSVGSAAVTVTSYNGLTAVCEVTVTPAPTSIRLNTDSIVLGEKESHALTAVTDYEGDAGVSYKSSRSSVAAVSADGRITAKKEGAAKITASTFNGLTAVCEVTVKKAPKKISLNETRLELEAGASAQLTYTLSSGSAGAVTFASSDEAVVTVDAAGLVTAVNEGSASVTATTYNGKEAVCRVKVTGVPAAPASDFKYSIEGGECTILKYTGSSTELVIPAYIEGAPVTKIDKYAFHDDDYNFLVRNLRLPNTMTRIEDDMFSETELESIYLPDSITYIGRCAFYSCSNLRSINIPRGLTKIEEDVLGWSGIESVTIPGNVKEIASGAFAGCQSLTTAVLEEGVQSVGMEAFGNCRELLSLTLPESLKSIGSTAFYMQAMDEEEFAMRKAYGKTGSYAEYFANLNGWTFVSTGTAVNPIGEYLYDVEDGECTIFGYLGEAKDELVIPSQMGGCPVTAIGDYAFEYNKATTIVIPEGVESIGRCAFYYSKALESVSLPSTLKTIGAYAFDDCYALRGLELNSGLETIGEGAFVRCFGLTNVVIPSGVKTIENTAFAGCENLKSITVPASVTQIDYRAFDTYTNDLVIYGVAGSAAEAYAKEYGVTFAEIVEEPDEPENPDEPAEAPGTPADSFEYKIQNGECVILDYLGEDASVTVPARIDGFAVTEIGDYAFANNAALEEILLPQSLRSIGSGAFSWCDALTEVVIPENVEKIGLGAFSWCGALVSVRLPAGLNVIEGMAFSWCGALRGVEIPAAVESIGNGAFGNCAEDFVVFGAAGSAAERFAAESGFGFAQAAKAEEFVEYVSAAAPAGWVDTENCDHKLDCQSRRCFFCDTYVSGETDRYHSVPCNIYGINRCRRCGESNPEKYLIGHTVDPNLPDQTHCLECGMKIKTWRNDGVNTFEEGYVAEFCCVGWHELCPDDSSMCQFICKNCGWTNEPEPHRFVNGECYNCGYVGEKIIQYISYVDNDNIPAGSSIEVRWEGGNSDEYIVDVKLLSGAPDYGNDNENGINLIPKQTHQNSSFILLDVPDSAAGKYIKVYVEGKSVSGAVMEKGKAIYLKCYEAGDGYGAPSDWPEPYKSVQSSGSGKPYNGTTIGAELLGKVLKVQDKSGGWFRMIAPVSGDYSFSVYAPEISSSFNMKIGKNSGTDKTFHYEKSDEVQTYVYKNVKKGEILVWWDDDDTGRGWTFLEPFELMISVGNADFESEKIAFTHPLQGMEVPGNEALKLEWTEIEGARYYLYSARYLDKAEAFIQRRMTNSCSATIPVTSVFPNKDLQLWVAAFDADDKELSNQIIQVRTSDAGALKIEFISPADGATVKYDESLKVEWTEVEEADHYEFSARYADEANAFIFRRKVKRNTEQTTIDFTRLKENKELVLWVGACDAYGNVLQDSTVQAKITVKTTKAPIPMVTGFEMSTDWVQQGKGVDFTVHTENAEKVQLIVDGKEYDVYEVKDNLCSFQRSFSEMGENRKVQFRAYGLGKWGEICTAQLLTVVEGNKMPAPQISGLKEGQILLDPDCRIRWSVGGDEKELGIGHYQLELRQYRDGKWRSVSGYESVNMGLQREMDLTAALTDAGYYHLAVTAVAEGMPLDFVLNGRTEIDFSLCTVPAFEIESIENDMQVGTSVTVHWSAPVWEADAQRRPDKYIVWWYGPGIEGGAKAEELPGSAVSATLDGAHMEMGGRYSVDVYAITGEGDNWQQTPASGTNSFTKAVPKIIIDSRKNWLTRDAVEVSGYVEGGVSHVRLQLEKNGSAPVALENGGESVIVPVQQDESGAYRFAATLKPADPLTEKDTYAVAAYGYLDAGGASNPQGYICNAWIVLDVEGSEVDEIRLIGRKTTTGNYTWRYPNEEMHLTIKGNRAMENLSASCNGSQITLKEKRELDSTDSSGNLQRELVTTSFSIDKVGRYMLNIDVDGKKYTRIIYIVDDTDVKAAYVKETKASLLSLPGSEGWHVKTVFYGQELEVLGAYSNYYAVRAGSQEGFIRASEVSLTQDSLDNRWKCEITGQDNGYFLQLSTDGDAIKDGDYCLQIAQDSPANAKRYTADELLMHVEKGNPYSRTYSVSSELELEEGHLYYIAVIPVGYAGKVSHIQEFPYNLRQEIIFPAEGDSLDFFTTGKMEIRWTGTEGAEKYQIELIHLTENGTEPIYKTDVQHDGSAYVQDTVIGLDEVGFYSGERLKKNQNLRIVVTAIK